MKVIVVDLGSRFNSFGGQARIAAILNKGLSKYFRTYYLGYPTAYSSGVRNPIMLKRNKLGLSVRRSRVSEMWTARLAYNLLVASGLREIDKEGLLRKAKEISPDFIIANSIQDINLLRFFRRSGLDFKAVYIDHGSVSTSIGKYLSKEGIPLTLGTGIDSLTLSGKKRKFFGFYDMNVALNRAQLAEMLKYTDKATLIPNGLEAAARRDATKEARLMRSYGIKPGDFVVLYIGRMFDRQKNVGALIRAFKEIRDDRMKLLLVGEGPSLDDYVGMAEGDRRVIFAGSATDGDVSSVYGISSLFVLPSFWEGFSLTVLEAAAHSLPMALSNDAYVDDLRGFGTIPSFNPESESEIRKSIEAVRTDSAVRRRAVAASQAIAKRFTEKRMIGDYKSMLERIRHHA